MEAVEVWSHKRSAAAQIGRHEATCTAYHAVGMRSRKEPTAALSNGATVAAASMSEGLDVRSSSRGQSRKRAFQRICEPSRGTTKARACRGSGEALLVIEWPTDDAVPLCGSNAKEGGR